MTYSLNDYMLVAARVLLGMIFVMAGFYKLFNWSDVAFYMSAHKVPVVPLALLISLLLELVCGLSVVLGYRAEMGAAVLGFYLLPVTLIFHHFWALDGMEAQAELINCMKNLSIMGGLLLIAGHGAGPLTLEERLNG